MSKPLFTTKHYKAIARMLNKVKPTDDEHEVQTFTDGYYKVVGGLTSLFRIENPKFDWEKFKKIVEK